MFQKHATSASPKSPYNPRGQLCKVHNVYYKGSYCRPCYNARRRKEIERG